MEIYKHADHARIIVTATCIVSIVLGVYTAKLKFTSSKEYKIAEQFIKDNKDINSIMDGEFTLNFIEGINTLSKPKSHSYEFDVLGENRSVTAIAYINYSETCTGYMIKAEIKLSKKEVKIIDGGCQQFSP